MAGKWIVIGTLTTNGKDKAGVVAVNTASKEMQCFTAKEIATGGIKECTIEPNGAIRTEGAWDRYPSFLVGPDHKTILSTAKGSVDRYTVLAKLVSGGKDVGYIICNPMGIQKVTLDNAMDLHLGGKTTNTSALNGHLKAIKGSFEVINIDKKSDETRERALVSLVPLLVEIKTGLSKTIGIKKVYDRAKLKYLEPIIAEEAEGQKTVTKFKVNVGVLYTRMDGETKASINALAGKTVALFEQMFVGAGSIEVAGKSGMTRLAEVAVNENNLKGNPVRYTWKTPDKKAMIILEGSENNGNIAAVYSNGQLKIDDSKEVLKTCGAECEAEVNKVIALINSTIAKNLT
jgi:hypothetical protein